MVLFYLVAAAAAGAQGTETNPATASVKEIYSRHSKYIAAAAAEMPADKYDYRPTPEQFTFGRIMGSTLEKRGSQ